MRDWIPILTALLLSYPLFLLLRMIFVAPYKLYQKEKSRNEKKISNIVPFHAAIDYIQKLTKFGKRMTYGEVFDELKRLSMGSAIEIKGREKGPYSQTANDFNSTVNLQGQISCSYENYGDLRTPALIVTKERPLWGNDPNNTLRSIFGSTLQTIYYNPVVSMYEIKRHFDDK